MNRRFFIVSVCFVGVLALLVNGRGLLVAQTQAQDMDHFVYLPLVITPDPTPVILYFDADVAIADPGDTIELSWGTANAMTITLYHLLPTGQLGTFWDVPETGTMDYAISEFERNQTRFVLYASRTGYTTTSQTLTVNLNCTAEWFFEPAPDICPFDPAIISAGAEQHFEHGIMLWVEGEDRIYVLFDDGIISPKWSAFTDEWNEGDPIDDPTIIPLPGYFQPKRGFGLVWREQPTIRDRLGWAVDLESPYETALQRTSYARYNDTYIRAVDGNVWRLITEQSGWEKIIVQP